jgi:hypothetical protein
MSMQTDVKASTITSTGAFQNEAATANIQRTRVKGIYFVGTGTVTLQDGGSGGVTRLSLTGGSGGDSNFVLIPGEGILFTTDVYGTLTTVSSVTIFYG